jgi:hypothetical protein
MDIRDRQYAVANKIPYEQLKQQKQLNKATIEGRAHGAAAHERSSGTRTSLHLCARRKNHGLRGIRASQREIVPYYLIILIINNAGTTCLSIAAHRLASFA